MIFSAAAMVMTIDSLWLDSSIIRMGATKLRELTQLAQRKQVRVVVHPHIHLEMCRYLRENSTRPFRQTYINQSLELLGITIADFNLTKETAESFAEILNKRYPTSSAWKNAKLSAVRARLPSDANAKAESVPMTTDWWVALDVQKQNGFIAVEDKGEEWNALRQMKPHRAMSYEACMRWLRDRPGTC
jgi:hypothetical protein